ncbi:MAG: rhodanese-like domain-containing protein [Vampirovibrionales bacterium]|nr:rhodanese-like domain-containing protein [Vampirovibrionales bacterium]
MSPIAQLENDTFQALIQSSPTLQLIDVRTSPEFSMLGHLPGAQLMPIQSFIETWHQLDPQKPVALVCQHGVRSMAAANWLQEQGFGKLYNLTHGMAQWDGALEFWPNG